MKNKKIICLCLSLIMLFNVLISISLAVESESYVVGGNTSFPFEWKNQNAGLTGDGRNIEAYLEYCELHVASGADGIYSVSNSENTPYVICTLEGNELRPVPIATYADENQNADNNTLGKNSAGSRTATVYLDSSKTYYICTTGENGTSLHEGDTSKVGQTIRFNFEYIEPPEGATPFTTNKSSIDFTASGVKVSDYFGWYVGSGLSVHRINRNGVSTTTLPELENNDVSNKLNNAASSSGDSMQDEKSAWYEQIITWLVLLVCDGARGIINVALNYDISIDDLLFNVYPSTRLAIFKSEREGDDTANGYLEEIGMLDNGDQEGIITKYFMLFRTIALAVYIVMLLYMGVNIISASTGSKKDRFKSKLMDWAKGIIIIAFFPYIMRYIIVINNAIVEYLKDIREDNSLQGVEMSGLKPATANALDLIGANDDSGDIMENVRLVAVNTGRVAYAILYLLLIKQLVAFIFMYFKRLLSVIFLIIIFPLVTISYAVDKIGDGKSQAFDAWLKEYTLNVFMQTFHAISYVLVTSVILAIGANSTANVILIMCGFEFITKTEELAKSLFNRVSGAKGGTVSTVNETMKTILKVRVAKDITDKVVGGTVNKVNNVRTRISTVKTSYREHENTKVREWDESRRNILYAEAHSPYNLTNIAENNAIDDISGNVDKALNSPDTLSNDEYKQVLDRLAIAKNDPNRSGSFQAVFNSLSESDQEKLNKLLAANDAINETVNDNHKVSGEVLTEREVNINANILVDIEEGADGTYDKLKGFINDGHNLLDENGDPLKDSAGKVITLKSRVSDAVKTRVLNSAQQEQMKKVQSFYGNAVRLDSSHGVRGISGGSYESASRSEVSYYHPTNPNHSSDIDVSSEANAIMAKHGVTTAGVSTDVANNRRDAARLIARVKRYTDDIAAGRMTGASINEGVEIAKEWRRLAGDNDAGVKVLMSQLGNKQEKISEYAKENKVSRAEAEFAVGDIEADVGFNLEQLEAMTAVNAVRDSSHIEGSAEDKQKIMDWAGRKLVQINDDADADKVARAIVNRAEADDLMSHVRENGNARNYVRQGKTQEEIRSERFIKTLMDKMDEEYERVSNQSNSRQTAVRLAKDVLATPVAVVNNSWAKKVDKVEEKVEDKLATSNQQINDAVVQYGKKMLNYKDNIDKIRQQLGPK